MFLLSWISPFVVHNSMPSYYLLVIVQQYDKQVMETITNMICQLY
jgi:hypothetical protein